MDSLWEDLNDDDAATAARGDGEDQLFRRSLNVSCAFVAAAKGQSSPLPDDEGAMVWGT
jgi:hypothetical protein